MRSAFAFTLSELLCIVGGVRWSRVGWRRSIIASPGD
jgi:hypothetical protein